ncbi:unnamed protein product [Rhizophagus irregularis]|nr:unnamed protein product [Rhizophagus irregularis]
MVHHKPAHKQFHIAHNYIRYLLDDLTLLVQQAYPYHCFNDVELQGQKPYPLMKFGLEKFIYYACTITQLTTGQNFPSNFKAPCINGII